MEKLQAALEKARSRRDADAEPEKMRQTAAGKPTAGRTDRLWEDLQEIELSGSALKHHRIVTQNASQEATPFDIMRTKILLQMRQNGWKRLAITSPMPKSGKTTTACNLALGIGRQGGLKTILFDIDLGDPSVAEFIGHKPQNAVSDMLTGRVSFSDQAVRVGQNVAISATAQKTPDPTQVLLSAQTDETLNRIQKTYDPDIMIFDTPSILTGDNTRAFLKSVDCALIITRANNTSYGHFDTCEREIAEYTNVLGVILNAYATKNMQGHVE